MSKYKVRKPCTSEMYLRGCTSGKVDVPCYLHAGWVTVQQHRSLFLFLCDIFRALINSLDCWSLFHLERMISWPPGSTDSVHSWCLKNKTWPKATWNVSCLRAIVGDRCTTQCLAQQKVVSDSKQPAHFITVRRNGCLGPSPKRKVCVHLVFTLYLNVHLSFLSYATL